MDRLDFTTHETQDGASEQPKTKLKRAIAMLGVGAIFTAGGFLGYKLVNDSNHPPLTVGDNHSDIKKLGKLLEGSAGPHASSYTPGDPEVVSPSEFTNEMLAALQKYQVTNGIADENIGRIREGDKTWQLLEDSQMDSSPPKGLPGECYTAKDVVCIDKNPDGNSAKLYVMHGGQEKFMINDVGVGRPGAESNNGSYKISETEKFGHTSSLPEAKGTPMAAWMKYNGGEGIHFSPTKAEKGEDYPGSFGCITIGQWALANSLFEYVEGVRSDNERPVKVIVSE